MSDPRPNSSGAPQSQSGTGRRPVRKVSKGNYPVAKPYSPPPGTGPAQRPVCPPGSPGQVVLVPLAAAPPAAGNLGSGIAVLKVGLLVALCAVCTAAGWFLFHGSAFRSLFRPKTPEAVAARHDGATHSAADRRADAVSAPNPRRESSLPPPTPPNPAPVQKEPPTPPRPDGDNGRRPTPPSKPPLVTFEKQVLPILQTKCAGCHGSPRRSGGLDVRTVASLKKGGGSGPAVTAGDPDKSPLWDEVSSNRMPPNKNNKLTAAEKQTIRDWIAGGLR
jgi:hypothetical protein